MKKFIYCIILLFSICLSSNAKQFNNDLEIGFHFGAIGQMQDLGLQIIVVNLNIKGVYIDFGGWPQAHEGDVRVDKWDSDRAWLAHIGYSIAFTKWLKITPMIGYAKDECGYTDGYRWRTDRNGIHNKFISEYKVEGFDYGGQLEFSIPVGKKTTFNIQGTFTNYCWYGGLGIGFKF